MINITNWIKKMFSNEDNIINEPERVLSDFFICSNVDAEFKLYLDIDNKTFIVKLNNDIVNLIFKKYSNFVNKESNVEIINKIVLNFYTVCKNNILSYAYTKSQDINLSIDNGLNIYLENNDMESCEKDLFLITDVLFNELNTFLKELDSINKSIKISRDFNKELKKNKNILLDKVVFKYEKVRKLK